MPRNDELIGWGVLITVLVIVSGCDARKTELATEGRGFGDKGLGTLRFLGLDDRWIEFEAAGRAPATVFLFARTDCPVSNRYAPAIRRLYELFHPRGVKFHLVYVNPGEDVDSIRRHVRDYGYPFEALRDPEHQFVTQVGARVTPEAVVLDAEGQRTYRGRIDNWYSDFGKSRPVATTRDLADAIEATLAGQHVAEPITEAVGCYIQDLK
jgi:hypothetical protein